MPELVLSVDLRGAPRLLNVSGDASAILGYSEDDFLSGKIRFEDRIHPEDGELARALFSLDSQQPAGTVVIRLRDANNRIRCVKARYVKASDPARGDLILVLTMRPAGEIEEPGDRILIAGFNALLENSPERFHIKNRNHVILAVSRAASRCQAGENDCTGPIRKTVYDLFRKRKRIIYTEWRASSSRRGRRLIETRLWTFEDSIERQIAGREYALHGPGGQIVGLFSAAVREPSRQLNAPPRLLAESSSEAPEVPEPASLDGDFVSTPRKGEELLERLPEVASVGDCAADRHWDSASPRYGASAGERFKKYFDAKLKQSAHSFRTARIFEEKKNQLQLERIAHCDLLTGLPNRRLLIQRLRQAVNHASRRSQSLAIAYLDLNDFQAVNGEHGYLIGDQMLRMLATRMKSALRQGDTLARLDKDNFVAPLFRAPGTDDALPEIRKLLNAVAGPVQVGNRTLSISATVGVIDYPGNEEVGPYELLRQAREAMCEAKLSGKNCFQAFSSLHDFSVYSRVERLEHVRDALDSCRLALHYQPKVNMRSGKVTGVEALLRLRHPQRGLLSPAMFLPLTEDQPLAIEIGEWVIDNALTQVEIWRASGLNLPVSVNVSGSHLLQEDFVPRLSALLAAHVLVQPSLLELEILESSALLDPAKAATVLYACQKLGISVSLDDFGTGFSSLSYLKQLPVNALKIDRSFVSGMLDDRENLSIVESVVNLAGAFGRQVIAEGVESAEHGAALLRIGCELGQGYGISHPLPASEVPNWVKSWRPDPGWEHIRFVPGSHRGLLHAVVEHMESLARLEAFLDGKSEFSIATDDGRCGLDKWFASGKRESLRLHPAIRRMEAAHQRFHTLMKVILDAHAGCDHPDLTASLTELRGLRDELRSCLDLFSGVGVGRLRSAAPHKPREGTSQLGRSARGKMLSRPRPVRNNGGLAVEPNGLKSKSRNIYRWTEQSASPIGDANS